MILAGPRTPQAEVASESLDEVIEEGPWYWHGGVGLELIFHEYLLQNICPETLTVQLKEMWGRRTSQSLRGRCHQLGNRSGQVIFNAKACDVLKTDSLEPALAHYRATVPGWGPRRHCRINPAPAPVDFGFRSRSSSHCPQAGFR